jgi:hypothetical protein
MKSILIKVVLVFLSVLVVTSPMQGEAKSKSRVQQSYTQKEAKLIFDLRKLWIDHTIWTRN